MSILYILARWVHVVILMGMTGASYYLVRMVTTDIRRTVGTWIYKPVIRYNVAFLLLITSVAVYLLQAGQVGDGWADTISVDIWSDLSETAFGYWWLIHFALTIIFCVMLCVLRTQKWWPVLAILCLASYGMTGHTAVHDGYFAWFYSAVQIIHLLAAAFWFGGLMIVVKLLPLMLSIDTKSAAIRALIRFSKAGHIAVIALILAGAFNIISVLGWPLQFMMSPYMGMLGAKLAAIAVLIGLAILNRYYWVPRFTAEYARKAFYRMTLSELVILLVVMALSSTLATFSPMPM